MTATRPAEIPEQTRVDLWPQHGQLGAGSGPSLSMQATQMYGFIWRQTPAAVNDKLYHDVWLKNGTYTVRMLYYKQLNGGIFSIQVDDLEYNEQLLSFSIDTYNAASQANQLANVGVGIKRSGKHRVSTLVTGKNASSGGFDIWMTQITLFMTSFP